MEDLLEENNGVAWRDLDLCGLDVIGWLFLSGETTFGSAFFHDDRIGVGGKGTTEILGLVIKVDPPPENVFIGPWCVCFFLLVNQNHRHGVQISVPRLFGDGGPFFSHTHPIKQTLDIKGLVRKCFLKLILEKLRHCRGGFQPQFSHNGVMKGCGIAICAETTHHIVPIMLKKFWKSDILELLAVISGFLLVQERHNGYTVLKEFHVVVICGTNSNKYFSVMYIYVNGMR